MNGKRLLIIAIVFFLFSGCVSSNFSQKITRSEAIEIAENFDWQKGVLDYFDSIDEKDKWNSCFYVSDDEFKSEILEIYSECVEQALIDFKLKCPETVTRDYLKRNLLNGVDRCAKMKFVVKNKNKFTFDKSPENIDRCTGLYKNIIKKLE